MISPKVSVIVPNYNHSAYLCQRIDSILQQSYTDYELILLDDCSTDASREVLAAYQHMPQVDRKSTRLNSSHPVDSRMPSSA